MKKRIQRIVLLALLANLGIIAFQIYWLRNTYEVNKARFEKDVSEALNDAIKHLVFDRFREEVNIVSSTKKDLESGFVGIDMIRSTNRIDTSISIAVIDSEDFENDQIKKKSNIRLIKQNIEFGDSFQVAMEEIVNRTLTGISDNSIDFSRLDTLYEKELNQRNITLPYFINYYRADSLLTTITHYDNFTAAYETNAIEGFGFLGHQSSVKASFPNQTLFLFRQMSFNILASILLLLITTASFIYMIRIIFEQKKLSDIKN
ncbi:MAG: hypothetical protein AAF806_28670, partial [Bacteroidota bacterium]